VLVARLPADSETGRAHLGEAASWSRTDHLLAGVFDALRVLIWQNENSGRKTPSRRPDPLPRPGTEPAEPAGTRIGSPLPLSEVKRLLASTRPGADQAGG
jgi:hypothetical protein